MDTKAKEKLKKIQKLDAEKNSLEKAIFEILPQERLEELEVLLEKRKKALREMEAVLLGSSEKSNGEEFPPGFSAKDEVLKIFEEEGDKGVHIAEILKRLEKRFPKYEFTNRQVSSALAYLKNQKSLIELVSRSTYRKIPQGGT